MDNEPIFKGKDLELIESLVLDATLEPKFCSFRDYLHWDDELPKGITPDGYDALCDLWIARSFIHRGLDFSAHPIDPEYIKQFWDRALKQNFKWTGFQRLSLSENDKAYYLKTLNSDNKW